MKHKLHYLLTGSLLTLLTSAAFAQNFTAPKTVTCMNDKSGNLMCSWDTSSGGRYFPPNYGESGQHQEGTYQLVSASTPEYNQNDPDYSLELAPIQYTYNYLNKEGKTSTSSSVELFTGYFFDKNNLIAANIADSHWKKVDLTHGWSQYTCDATQDACEFTHVPFLDPVLSFNSTLTITNNTPSELAISSAADNNQTVWKSNQFVYAIIPSHQTSVVAHTDNTAKNLANFTLRIHFHNNTCSSKTMPNALDTLINFSLTRTTTHETSRTVAWQPQGFICGDQIYMINPQADCLVDGSNCTLSIDPQQMNPLLVNKMNKLSKVILKH